MTILLQRRVKAEIEAAEKARESLQRTLSQYLTLRNNIEIIKQEKLQKLKLLVDLGSKFYMKAKVDDTTYIYVNIGLGFHVQFTHDEALAFIAVKEKQLSERIEAISMDIARVKANYIEFVNATKAEGQWM